LIVILAVALGTIRPSNRRSNPSMRLNKLVALPAAAVPLAVIVLIVYLGFIPFNFREPFENRDVLVIFNAMLFAVIALLIGATPVKESDLDARAQTWLRRGVIALSALALLIGVYALAAIVPREHYVTPNRLTHQLERDQHRAAGLAADRSMAGRRALVARHARSAGRGAIACDMDHAGHPGAAVAVRGDPGSRNLPVRIQQLA
jgi:hypothetical protein